VFIPHHSRKQETWGAKIRAEADASAIVRWRIHACPGAMPKTLAAAVCRSSLEKNQENA
jgi:hypothetical protein